MSDPDVVAMHGLLCAQFDGVSFDRFRHDLDEKPWVVLLAETDATIRGFSTLDVYERRFRGSPITVVYSGDTVVDAAVAGSHVLSSSWIGAVRQLRRLHPRGQLYWLLIVSGYRTYRFLPVYWKNFHPRFDASPSHETRDLLDFLATDRFGTLYNRQRGIVRFPEPQVLREGLCGIPPGRLDDPHVAFFASRNPEHQSGDELVCVTELSWENLTRAGQRIWKTGERQLLLDASPVGARPS